MEKNVLINEVLKPFLEQVKMGDMRTVMFPKMFDNEIAISVGLGQGQASNVPFIAFLGKDQEVQNGIYPVVAYYKNHDVLFLAYGVSVNNQPALKWDADDKKFIDEYFKDLDISLKFAEAKYCKERIYSMYKLKGIGAMDKEILNQLAEDIIKFVGEYKKRIG